MSLNSRKQPQQPQLSFTFFFFLFSCFEIEFLTSLELTRSSNVDHENAPWSCLSFCFPVLDYKCILCLAVYILFLGKKNSCLYACKGSNFPLELSLQPMHFSSYDDETHHQQVLKARTFPRPCGGQKTHRKQTLACFGVLIL